MTSDTARMKAFELKLMREPSSDLFDSTDYLNGLRTYYAYYGVLASYKIINRLDNKKTIKWVESTMKANIIQKHIKEMYCHEKKRMASENVLYLLNNEILIDIEENGYTSILYQTGNEKAAQEIVDKIKLFKQKRKIEPKISVITNSSRGLGLSPIDCPKPKLLMERNYNDDLQVLHKDIVKSLSNDNKSGLFLFHGLPGTGKSTYIRYLVSNVRKQFIFLSPRLAGNLDAPNFISLLIENRNSVLVIEDAEDLLTSRERDNNSAISILLNLTDGILGESLGIQTICTFNTQAKNIDEALMRKGRLMAMYEFKELETSKANLLLKETGTGVTTHTPMTLAEIYNTDKKEFSLTPGRKQIGFKVA